jgi:hypothetical protein
MQLKPDAAAAVFSFVRERYEAQVRRAEHFDNQIKTVITGLSVVGGLVGYLVGTFSTAHAIGVWLFWVPISGALVCFGLSILFLAKSYLGPRLEDLAPPSRWLEHLNVLQQNQATSSGHSPAPLEEFTGDLIERYAEAASHNQGVNDRVGYALENAIRFLIGALSGAIVAGASFFYFS